MKTSLPIIGIDPGVSAGYICVYIRQEVKFHKIPETISEMIKILKPYSGMPGDKECRCSIEMLSSRPHQNPFINKRMEPMIINQRLLKEALALCDIPFKEVHPKTWQKWHGLVLPDDLKEKGLEIEYQGIRDCENDIELVKKHQSIIKKMKNKVVMKNGEKHICTDFDIHQERVKLGDKYTHMGENQLKNELSDIDKEIDKYKRKISQFRKKRYQKKAQQLSGDENLSLNKSDAFLICVYEYNN